MECSQSCAGNYATENEHWEVVNFLVDAGTKAELILGASIRLERQIRGTGVTNNTVDSENENSMKDEMDVSRQPCTKLDYIQTNVRYDAANTLLLDGDNDAVMMEWERPLMEAHANFLAVNAAGPSDNESGRKRVLNVGFGLGIIDTFIQSHNPSLHVIIEAHPTVYEKMISDGWNKKDNVQICFGRWQDELPKLIQEGVEFDGIFYDTYGEVRSLRPSGGSSFGCTNLIFFHVLVEQHFTDLEDFHHKFPLYFLACMKCISAS